MPLPAAPAIPIPETPAPTPATSPTDKITPSTDIWVKIQDMFGIFIGFGIMTLGIVILIVSDEKVQDAARKVAGAAAAINPELTAAAAVTNIATGRKPTQEHVTTVAKQIHPTPYKKPGPKTAHNATLAKPARVQAKTSNVPAAKGWVAKNKVTPDPMLSRDSGAVPPPRNTKRAASPRIDRFDD